MRERRRAGSHNYPEKSDYTNMTWRPRCIVITQLGGSFLIFRNSRKPKCCCQNRSSFLFPRILTNKNPILHQLKNQLIAENKKWEIWEAPCPLISGHHYSGRHAALNSFVAQPQYPDYTMYKIPRQGRLQWQQHKVLSIPPVPIWLRAAFLSNLSVHAGNQLEAFM